MVDYLEDGFVSGMPSCVARCVVYGMAFVEKDNLCDSDVLLRSRKTLTGWNRLTPDLSRDPRPWALLASGRATGDWKGRRKRAAAVGRTGRLGWTAFGRGDRGFLVRGRRRPGGAPGYGSVKSERKSCEVKKGIG